MADIIVDYPDGKRQVRFSRTYKNLPFEDALWFDSLDDYNTKTEQEIQQMEDDRFNHWVYSIENPPPSQDVEESN